MGNYKSHLDRLSETLMHFRFVRGVWLNKHSPTESRIFVESYDDVTQDKEDAIQLVISGFNRLECENYFWGIGTVVKEDHGWEVLLRNPS